MCDLELAIAADGAVRGGTADNAAVLGAGFGPIL